MFKKIIIVLMALALAISVGINIKLMRHEDVTSIAYVDRTDVGYDIVIKHDDYNERIYTILHFDENELP